MLIIYTIIAWIATFIGSFMIVKTVHNAKVERNNKAFANLPNEVLLTFVKMDPVYSSHYHNVLTTMSEKEAAEIVINRMLIDKGLIGYRKAES